jgi:hypothetical protein
LKGEGRRALVALRMYEVLFRKPKKTANNLDLLRTLLLSKLSLGKLATIVIITFVISGAVQLNAVSLVCPISSLLY